jgi:lycopene cyclase CruA
MPGGESALQAVVDLEARWLALNTEPRNLQHVLDYVPSAEFLPACPPEHKFDVVIAGGGLGLVAGAALAARGLSVMVFDRDRVGAAHREWNISERELSTLVRSGIFTAAELRETVAARYNRGVISFDATETGVEACPLVLSGVLDVSLDAQKVLDLARKRFLAAGGVIFEGRSFKRLHIAERGQVASVFEVQGPDGVEYYRARLAIDTMGSVSPIATALNRGLAFNGVCPTVGTVMLGLDLEPATGDVLVTVAPAQEGRQLIWEGFPGHDGETTTYLFYYDQTGKRQAASQSLLALFEQYFALLPSYRRVEEGHRHLKPVFGYIPARHGRPGRTAGRGLLCLGDSAAGQSPITFCGFGSFVRHIGRTAMLIEYSLHHDLLEETHLSQMGAHQANLRVAWVFSRFMQTRPGDRPTAVNRMMNIFGEALNRAGERTTVRFLQDRYTFTDYIRIMLLTARIEPAVFALTARALGPLGLIKWALDMAAFAVDGLLRSLYTLAGPVTWRAFEAVAERLSPAIALRLKSARTAWQASTHGEDTRNRG